MSNFLIHLDASTDPYLMLKVYEKKSLCKEEIVLRLRSMTNVS
jgi:hypothetical protein